MQGDENAELRTKDARISELEAALVERDAQIARLEDALTKLKDQVEQLSELLGRDSSNSHLPPSSDGPGAASRGKTRAPKKKSKHKRGGQKGRRGAHRELVPIERVDEVVEMFPPACLGCGSSLPHTPDVDPRRHQTVELLLEGLHVTEFRRHEVACPRCGQRTRAAYDESRIPASPFGPRLVSIIALLTGVYHLSRRATQRLLHELFGLSISLGALSNIEARASAALKPAYEQAEREVDGAAVKHGDATSWLRAGVLTSLWTLASMMATVYKIFDDGRRETIEPLFGMMFGILVSDRATVFNFWTMARRQICWAHLLRKFVSFSERDGPAGVLGRRLLDCTALVFDYWRGLQNGELTREELETWLRPVRRQFETTLERAVAAKIPRLSGSCADILAHQRALWTFVTHEGVEPTNNHAERELRGFVLWRKRSFGSQSERGDRFAERLMTVAHTARKLGTDVLDFIVRSVTAHLDGTSPPLLLGSAAAG